jgi:hypothetical protein
MAHSLPVRVTNRGDAGRVVMAIGAFLDVLSRDLRVLEAGRAWSARHDINRHLLALQGTPSDAVVDAFVKSCQEVLPADREAMRRLVHDGLRIPHRPWVAIELLRCFSIAAYNAVNPREPKLYMPAIHMVPNYPKGRMPRNAGADIKEHVQWYYRADIKDPPDRIAELEREWSEKAGRQTEAHSVIRNGIEQAKALLDLVVAVDDWPK